LETELNFTRNLQADSSVEDESSETTSNPSGIFERREWNWLSNVIVITILIGVIVLVGAFLSFYFMRRWIRKKRAQRRFNHQREKYAVF
jgi:heme/copper-type cytochrome/quinol oxidase subunit 2